MLYQMNEKIIELERNGKKIIKLYLGDPDQDTDPRIMDAAIKSMQRGNTHYSSAMGEKTLRDALAERHRVDAGKVVITPGSKWAIFSLLFLILKDGGNMIVPSPHWISYELIPRRIGAHVKFLKTEIASNWKIDVEKLHDLIDNETKLILLNNPSNPTSTVIDDDTLEEIVRVANKQGISILSDETYSDISFVKTKRILDFEGNHILVNSFSKTFAMTGWRLGYAIVGDELRKAMTSLNQITVSNVPVFIQDAGVKALELQDEISQRLRRVYEKRARLACNILSHSKIRFAEPDAPFYLFPQRDGVDSEKFIFDLLKEGIAVAPGTSFGEYRDCIRISLTRSEDEIKTGLEKIVELIG